MPLFVNLLRTAYYMMQMANVYSAKKAIVDQLSLQLRKLNKCVAEC